jgi:hypothetical protein
MQVSKSVLITRCDFVASGLRMPTFHIEDPVFLDSCYFFDFCGIFSIFLFFSMLNFFTFSSAFSIFRPFSKIAQIFENFL